MKHLIDTDVVADHLAGRQHATDVIDSLLSDGIGISLMTYGEIYEGVLYSRRSQSAEIAFLNFLRWAKVVPLDEAMMHRFAGIRGGLRRRGFKLDTSDLLIAATALHHDLTLVTRNRKHFERIEWLKLYEFDQTSR